MFKFLSHKLLNKKWLNACLLLGIVLLVAVASCNPMFKNGALDMLMSSKFDAAMTEQNKYPSTIGREGSCAVDEYPDSESVLNRIEKYKKMWNYYLEIDTIEEQTSLSLEAGYTQSNLGHRSNFKMVYMPNLEDHINITYGVSLEDAKTESGVYPCLISQRYLDEYNLVVGEVFTIDTGLGDVKDASGNPMKYQIVGVFEEKDYSDDFWYDQLADLDRQVYVIEVNPRSSRTVPYISKVTGIPIVDLATKVIIGHKIKELGYTPGLQPEADYFAIKMPVFSFEKIRGADISLGPEMKSTGECLGIAKTFDEALYKAFIGAGVKLPKHKNMIMTVRDEDKEEAVEIGRRFEKIGYKIFATEGTAKVLTDAGVKAMTVNKIEQESPNLMDLILGHKIDLVIDTPPQGADHSRDGFVIRRNAIETGVNVLTAIDTAKALITSLENTDIQKLTLIDIAKIK